MSGSCAAAEEEAGSGQQLQMKVRDGVWLSACAPASVVVRRLLGTDPGRHWDLAPCTYYSESRRAPGPLPVSYPLRNYFLPPGAPRSFTGFPRPCCLKREAGFPLWNLGLQRWGRFLSTPEIMAGWDQGLCICFCSSYCQLSILWTIPVTQADRVVASVTNYYYYWSRGLTGARNVSCIISNYIQANELGI